MGSTPLYPATPNNGLQTFVNADGTTKKTVFTAGASGSRMNALNIATDDSASHDLQLWLNTGGSDQLLGTIAIAAGAGNTSGVAQVNALMGMGSVLDPSGFLILKAAAVLKLSVPVAITAAKTLYATAIGSDF